MDNGKYLCRDVHKMVTVIVILDAVGHVEG